MFRDDEDDDEDEDDETEKEEEAPSAGRAPPKPTDDLRNLGPMRESTPMAWATSVTLAPVTSQSAEIELIDEMRCGAGTR